MVKLGLCTLVYLQDGTGLSCDVISGALDRARCANAYRDHFDSLTTQFASQLHYRIKSRSFKSNDLTKIAATIL